MPRVDAKTMRSVPSGPGGLNAGIEVVLRQAVSAPGVVGDVGLLGAAGPVRVHGVDGEGVAARGAGREGNRGGVPGDGGAPHVGSASQAAPREVDGGVGAQRERARDRRGDDLGDVERGAAGEDVEVLRAVRRWRDGPADVDDLADRARHPRRALALVPLLDDAVGRDRVDRRVVVVVVGHVADGRRRELVAEVLEQRTAPVGDAVRAVEHLRPVEVLPHEPARSDVIALERHLEDGELVVLHRRVECEAPARPAAQAVLVEHPRRVALRHHAALLHEDRLHLLREEQEPRVQPHVRRRRVRLCPLQDGLVARVLHRREERAALVVAPSLRGREGAAQELALRGRGREVLGRREVVPARLLRRAAAREVERVDERAVAVAGGARLREERADVAREAGVVRAGRVDVRVEPRRAGRSQRRRDRPVARRVRQDDGRVAAVVLRRAVLNPATQRLVAAGRRNRGWRRPCA